MASKFVTGYFTTLANASQQSFTFVTPDDQFARTLTSVYINVPTAGVNVQINRAGSLQAQIDGLRFANGNNIVPLNILYQAGLQIQLLLQDLAGAAHTNLGIVIGYDTQNT